MGYGSNKGNDTEVRTDINKKKNNMCLSQEGGGGGKTCNKRTLRARKQLNRLQWWWSRAGGKIYQRNLQRNLKFSI